MTRLSKLAVVCCLTLWAAGILFGTRYVNRYSNTPGESAPPVERWPTDTALHIALKEQTLLVAIHPQCPCSAASIAELSRVIAQSGQHPLIYALVYQPLGRPSSWRDTPVVRAASDIPGLRIVVDPNGSDIARFHARTSGEVLLYDASGRLRFQGGVTARRGHPGESKGADVLAALLRGADLSFTQTSTFGCSLRHAPEATEATDHDR